jgi:hypothetical protein
VATEETVTQPTAPTQAEVGRLLSAVYHALGTHALSGRTTELEETLTGAATLIIADRVEPLNARIDRLQRWMDEAIPVLGGLQKLGRALGLRLGTSITGEEAVRAAERLKAERDAARDDEREAWASWLDAWLSAVGPEPPTVVAVLRALREGPRPFGTGVGR